MTIEISFDKIADVYDAQRAHPPEVAAQIGQAFVAELGVGAHVLELGVGTGRIALPAAAAGLHVTGIDISSGMLVVAAEHAYAAGVTLDLHQGDAHDLPFPTDHFDAALAVHVLHLLADWRKALSEIARVVRAGGALIQGSDWRDPDSCVGRLRSQLRLTLIELMPGIRPPGAGAALAQALARYGGRTAEPQVAARWVMPISPAQVIAGMAARIDTETWVLPDEVLGSAMERIETWAAAQWPDLSAPQLVEHRFVLTTTRFC